MTLSRQDLFQEIIHERYTIEREIGAGGMATVFLAHDRKHDRPVALKVLKPELGAVLGAERFLAEIRVTANLQHPHLLPLFDSGEAADLLYFVMPFIDGESLRARLAREQQLPVGEAIRIAIAIAGALDYAHRNGIVHRDLKPENILLHEGLPLVADFGIALAVSRAGGERVTQTGLSVGTPQYMSPEQAAGERQLDGRSDIYALGTVLYEMLTGDPPHVGRSTQAVIARVMSEPPRSIRISRPTVPGYVEAAVMRALEKVPADRYDSAREFAAALSPAATTGAPHSSAGALTGASAAAVHRPPGARWLAAAAAAAVVLFAILGWLWTRSTQGSAVSPRFILDALPNQTGPVLVTPDGSNLIYTGVLQSQSALFVRRVDELTPRSFDGTDGVMRAFASPNGHWIGFVTRDDKLMKAPIQGGTATLIASSFRFANPSWGDGDVIVSDGFGLIGLTWVLATGGIVHPLTLLDSVAGEREHITPMVLPGGHGVVFNVRRFVDGSRESAGDIAYVPIDREGTRPAQHSFTGARGRFAIGVVDGWLLYAGEDRTSIAATRFDVSTGRSQGEPVIVLEDHDGMIATASLSRDGTLVYSRAETGTNEAKLVDTAGSSRPLIASMANGPYMNPRLSPDGRRLLVQGSSPQGSDVWIYDIATHGATRMTIEGNILNPVWSPDGQRIIYVKPKKLTELWWARADGSTPAERLFSAEGILLSASPRPDGREVVFERNIAGNWSIWRAEMTRDATLHPVVRERFDNYMPALSPDGQRLAYVSNATGRYEVYVRPYPTVGVATQVSDGGGLEPRWSHDGRRLFYRNAMSLIAATIAPTAPFTVSRRVTLFRDNFEGGMPHANYDVTGDDRNFVMIGSSGATREPRTVVVVNWLPELKARLAKAK